MDIGIIGGADGPTSVFIASNHSPIGIAAVIILFIAAVAIMIGILRKNKK